MDELLKDAEKDEDLLRKGRKARSGTEDLALMLITLRVFKITSVRF